ATHRAEPDETERRHQPLPSSTTAIALISSLHRAWVARRDTSTVVVVGRWPPRYAAHTRFRSSCSATSVRKRVAETRSAKVHPAASSVFLRFSIVSTACSRILPRCAAAARRRGTLGAMPVILVLEDDSATRNALVETLRKLFPQARVASARSDAAPGVVAVERANVVLASLPAVERLYREG